MAFDRRKKKATELSRGKRKLEAHRKKTPEGEWGLPDSEDRKLLDAFRKTVYAVTAANTFAIKVIGTIRDGQCEHLSAMSKGLENLTPEQKAQRETIIIDKRVEFLCEHVVQLLDGKRTIEAGKACFALSFSMLFSRGRLATRWSLASTRYWI